MTGGQPRVCYATATFLACAMAANFVPTPLYPRYQEKWDLSPTQISVAFSVYAIAVLVVLMTLGGLSDRVGRIPALRAGSALLLIALVVLAAASSYEMLLAGRVLQGLGTAITSSAGGAALTELHPRGVRAGSFQFTLALACGIAVGPVLSGWVASHAPAPEVAPYVVIGVIMLLPALMLATTSLPECRSGGRLIRPIVVPRRLWVPFGAVIASIAATNVCLGVIGTFGPEIAEALGWMSASAAGALVSVVMLSIAVAQLLGRVLPTGVSLWLCCVIGAAGWGVLTLGLRADDAGIVVGGAIVLGCGAGLGLLSSTARSGAIAPPERRAQVQSAHLVAAFVALTLSSTVLGGPVLTNTSLTTALVCAAVVDLVLLVAALLFTRATVATGGTHAAMVDQ